MNLARPPRALLPILSVCEHAYRWGVAVDRWRHAHRSRRGDWPLRLPRPVVSVGNIVVGGTGKTPLVEALARDWLRRGGRPALLSRGYRGGPDGNDEFKVLERRLPGVPHVQDPNRHRGGLRVLESHPDTDLFILDDGFQHRSLHRDRDLVVIDATRPFGYGHCLPRGLLREPWPGLERADHFLLAKSQGVSPHKLAVLRTFLRERFPGTPVTRLEMGMDGLRGPAGERADIEPGQRWAAFCGIGNPGAFFRSLAREGFDVVATRSFRDHHRFRPRDLERLRRWCRDVGADALICTEKDGVKLEALDGFSVTEPRVFQFRLVMRVGRPHPLEGLTPRGA